MGWAKKITGRRLLLLVEPNTTHKMIITANCIHWVVPDYRWISCSVHKLHVRPFDHDGENVFIYIRF